MWQFFSTQSYSIKKLKRLKMSDEEWEQRRPPAGAPLDFTPAVSS